MKTTNFPQVLQHFLSINEIKLKDIDNTYHYDFSLHVLSIIDKKTQPVLDLAGLCILREINANDISTGTQSKIVVPEHLFLGTGAVKGIMTGKELKKMLKKIPKIYIYKLKPDKNCIISNIFNIIKLFAE